MPKQDQATAAASAMNGSQFRNRALRIELTSADSASAKRNLKQSTTIVSPSPEPSYTTAHAAPLTTSANGAADSARNHNERTIALMSIPDTVNDARIRALCEAYGALRKIVLIPEHSGAIVEFAHVQDVGKASLGLEGAEIAPGRTIRVGSVEEMRRQNREFRTDRLGVKRSDEQKKKEGGGEAKKALPFGAPVSRPVMAGVSRGGRRGGLGSKGRGGFGGPRAGAAPDASASAAEKMDVDAKPAATGGAKSNADFKAMFLKGKDAEAKEGGDA